MQDVNQARNFEFGGANDPNDYQDEFEERLNQSEQNRQYEDDQLQYGYEENRGRSENYSPSKTGG